MSSPTSPNQQALNQAMIEAVEFVHAEGWDAAPTLFALVPTALLIDQLDPVALEEAAPLTLVVQDDFPDTIEPGSEQLADYIARLSWPAEVAGVIVAQEILFRDTAEATSTSGTTDSSKAAGTTSTASATADSARTLPPARPARLFSGVLREEGVEQTLLQIRPTEEELEAKGPFAQDDIELRGGPDVAPGVLAALRYGLEQDPEDLY